MKTKIILSVFLFLLLNFFAVANQAKATVGASCTSIANCSTGEWCSSTQNNTCQYIVAGTPCSSDSFCKTGNPALTCGSTSSAINVCVAATTSTTTQSTSATTNTNTSAVSSSGCDDTNLVNVNGLCLPKNPFTSGIAASTSLSDFLVQIIKILLTLAGTVGVLVLIVGGFWYITSAGNEEQSEKGKKAIIDAVIGIVIIVLSYVIITVLNNTLTQTLTK